MPTGLIKKRITRTQHPDSVLGLDAAHPLRKDIAFAMFHGDGAVDQFYDLHSGRFFPAEGTVAAWGRGLDKNGRYYLSNPSSSSLYARINLGQPEALEFSGADQFTILQGFVRTGNQPAGWGRLVCRTNGGTGDDWGLILANDAGGGHARFRINGNNLDGSTTLNNNQFYQSACTYKQGDRKLILDGVVDASDAYSGTLANDQNIWIGGNPGSNGDRVAEAKIYYTIFLKRALSVKEVRNFQNNIYQILQPHTKYYPVDFTAGDTNINATSVSHTLTTYNPTVSYDVEISPNSTAHTLTAYNPVVSLGVNIAATSAAHTLTVYNPAVSYNIGIAATTAAKSLTTNNPVVNYSVGIDATSTAHTLTTFNPAVSFNVNIDSTSAAKTITTYNPVLDFGGGLVINATSVSHSLTAFNPTVSFDLGITPNATAQTITTYNPTVSYGLKITPNNKAITLTAYNVIISYDTDILATSQALSLTSYNPVVQYGVVLGPDSEGLEYTLPRKKRGYMLSKIDRGYTLKLNKSHYNLNER